MKKGIARGIFALLICGIAFGLTGCKKHEHEYNSEVTKEATCTEKGTKTFTCECGDTYTEDIAALGHNMGSEWVKDETSHWKECTRCGGKAELAAHTWNEGETVSELSCTTDGKKVFTCTVCGQTKEEVTPAQHTTTKVEGNSATEFAPGTLDYYVCSTCNKTFLDEECTHEFTTQEELVDPIKSITVTEAYTKEVGEEVCVRGVVIGAFNNNDYKELLIKDLENDKIIAVSGYDDVFTITEENLLGDLRVGQVVACYGKMKCDVTKTKDGVESPVTGGQLKKIRIAGDNVVVSELTASTKVNHPENVPVVRTTQELNEVLKAEHSQYQYIKLEGPIYGYFAKSNDVFANVRFWLGANNNKDQFCTETNGGSCLTAYGITTGYRTRPLINLPAVATNFGGKTLAECFGITDMSQYTSYTKYFTFEGEMYVVVVGGNVWSAHFLPLCEEDIVAHDTCAKFAFAHEAVELGTTHGAIAYYECAYCGKLYKDAACTQEITLEDTVIHNYVHHDAVAVGCENDGLKEHYECTICGQKAFKVEEEYVRTSEEMVITKLGHDYGDLIPEVLPTTETEGLQAHYVCSRCSKVFDKDFNETTLEALKIEKVQHVHTFTVEIPGQAATCSNDGWKACYQCSEDGCGAIAATLNGELAASSLDAWKAGEGLLPHHDFRHIEAVTALCHTNGNVEYWYCADCNIYYKTADADPTKVYANVDETVTLAGHNYGTNEAFNVRTATGEQTIRLCTVCEHYVDQNTGAEYSELSYGYLIAPVGFTFANGDKVLFGNGQGGSGPGTRIAYSNYTTQESGHKSFSNSLNNKDEAKGYDEDCIFTLVEGTGENAGKFAIKNFTGKYIGTNKDAKQVGYGSGSATYWNFEVKAPTADGRSNDTYVTAPITVSEKVETCYIAARYYSSKDDAGNVIGYVIGRTTSKSNTLAVYVYLATLTPVQA